MKWGKLLIGILLVILIFTSGCRALITKDRVNKVLTDFTSISKIEVKNVVAIAHYDNEYVIVVKTNDGNTYIIEADDLFNLEEFYISGSKIEEFQN